MGDTWLNYVPLDPHWRPRPEAAEQAADYLRGVFKDADEVVAEASDQMRFVDALELWESVACPACGADFEAPWSDAIEVWEASGFQRLALVAPCCGAQTTLNDLHYTAPCAFGCFRLAIMNPHAEPSEAQDAEVAALIGAPLRKVWARL